MKKSDYWIIEYSSVIHAKVVFDGPVNEAEAIRLFERSQYADILDTTEMNIIEVLNAEPIGDVEDDD